MVTLKLHRFHPHFGICFKGIARRVTFQFLEPGTAQICGKIPAKSTGTPEADNNVEQQLVVVLMNKNEGFVFRNVDEHAHL